VLQLPTTYDPLFRRYGDRVPVAFLRALAQRESSFNPNESQDPAWGLMQIVPTVRTEYNRLHGTNYQKTDLLNPEVSVRIASDLLNRIVKAYEKHPDPNMKYDPSNPEFWKLVVAGWNSGYSEAGGVGKVARYLESRNIPVTHDNVFRYASAAGATIHLSNPAKQAWQRTVADLYFSQPDAGSAPSNNRFLLKVGITVAVGLIVAKYVLK